jgi:DNA-binding response OmpR family regulator
MDGLALARSLRAINQKLPIIATTGLDREEKRDALATLGITDVLTKPCLPSLLLAAVRRNLDR